MKDLERSCCLWVDGLGARELYDSAKNYSLSLEKFLDLVGVWIAVMEGPVKTQSRAMSGLFAALMIAVVGFDSASQRAAAGLPGYFEWVLWKDVQAENPTEQGETDATLEWIVGPYAKLSDCEHDRDRLAEATVRRAHQHSTGKRIATAGAVTVTADQITTRFFCVPDTVNPRVDRRWP